MQSDRKEGKPFMEKVAMLVVGFLLVKYTVKALRNLPKKEIKGSWLSFYVMCFLTMGVMFGTGAMDVNSGGDDLTFIFAVLIYGAIFQKHFLKEKPTNETRSHTENQRRNNK